MKSIFQKILTACFCVIIVGIFFVNYSLTDFNNTQIIYAENRRISQYHPLKSLRGRDLRAYFSNLNSFIGDRLWKRDEIMTLMHKILGDPALCFESFVDSNKVVIGKDGFLFLGNSYSSVVDRHFKRDYKTQPRDVDKFIRRMQQLQKVSESVGAKFSLLVAPDKHGIYSDFFPNIMKQKADGTANEVSLKLIKELLAVGIDCFYPYQILRQERQKSLYFKTDSHWNMLGAGIAFEHFMAYLKANKLFPQTLNFIKPSYVKTELNKVLDLGVLAGVSRDFKANDVDYNLENSLQVWWSQKGQEFNQEDLTQVAAQGCLSDWYGEMKNPAAPNRLRVLVVCDSFMIAMSRFFNLNFANVFFISRHHDSDQVLQRVESFKPDLVIYETVERDFP